MPAIARTHTAAGARAFAEFFIRTIDWGFATTSGAYMRHYFEPSCIECRSHADGLDNTRKDGGHYIGGRFTNISARQVNLEAHAADAATVVTFDISSVEAIDQRGVYRNGDEARSNVIEQLWLGWHSGSWRVVESEPGQ